VSLTLTVTPIHGVCVVHRTPITDERGSFQRLFDLAELDGLSAIGTTFQVNHVRTASAGTVRGLHIQMPPHSETKLVSCIRGAVFDVAVDLRGGSPTFGRWFGQKLSATNNAALLIPEGCAHGVQSLQDNSEIVYVHSAAYEPGSESGLSPSDSKVAIEWPLPVANLSKRDSLCRMSLMDFSEVDW